MGRIIVVVLTLAALSFLVRRVMYAQDPAAATAGAAGATTAPSGPPQQLGNVRSAANRIEANDQQHLDDIDKKTTGN